MNNMPTSQKTYLHYNSNTSGLELLYDALDINGIPTPRHVRSSGFTRWGKNQRYWATGLKLTHDERLIIPAYSCDNKISTLQFINLDGEKKFLKNGRKQGCFFPIGVPSIRILLCEGYATGCSIYEAAKELTICCFDAGNLIHVARKFRECYPEKEIIICADNDSGKEKNTGVEKAKEAGREIGAAVVFPVFKDETASPTDFNDLQNLEGIETVRKQIEQAFSKGGSNDGNAS